MRSEIRRNDKGFTLAEVVVALAVMAVALTATALLMGKASRMRDTSQTLTSIKQIENALETTYREDIAYVESNCAGWGDTGCTAGTITPSAI